MSQSPESAATAFVPTMSPSKLSAKRRQSADVPAASDGGANAQFEKRPRPMERWGGAPAEEQPTPNGFPEASRALRRLDSQLEAERLVTDVAGKVAKAIGAIPRTSSPVAQHEVRKKIVQLICPLPNAPRTFLHLSCATPPHQVHLHNLCTNVFLLTLTANASHGTRAVLLQKKVSTKLVWKRHVYESKTVYEGFMANNKREVAARAHR
jgi:hypothetical protein